MSILKENLYAVRQLDAFGKFPPAGLLELGLTDIGSAGECKDISGIKYNTHFCYMRSDIGSAKEDGTCKLGLLKHAVCMPKSCTENDLVKIMNRHPNNSLTTYCDATCAGDHMLPKDAFFWISSTFFTIIALLMILSTLIDYYLQNLHPEAPYKSKNIGLQSMLTFSVYTNGGLLMSTKPAGDTHIRCLDCIRFLSMTWVLSGHTLNVFEYSDAILPMIKVAKKLSNTMYTNPFFCVDSFFVLSGIVVSYLFFKSVSAKDIKRPTTWILYYIHRYLRLTPPVMFFIVFLIAYESYIDGPWVAAVALSDDIYPNIPLCKKYWWRNLIYINNFQVDQCYGPLWYLATDFQLYIVTPIFLIILYYSFTAGCALLLAALAGSITATTIIYYKYDLPAITVDFHMTTKQTNDFYKYFYKMPWTRCPPYLFGILTGYLLAKKLKRGTKLHPILIILGWMTATAMALGAIFSIHSYIEDSRTWSEFTRSVYQNLSRIGWSIAVCWVVIANHVGWGGPINEFMSYPLWQPLGRLSYSAYIVHVLVMVWFFNLQDRPTHYVSVAQTMLSYALPITIISYFAAFFWSCAFEVPFAKLEKIALTNLLPTSRK